MKQPNKLTIPVSLLTQVAIKVMTDPLSDEEVKNINVKSELSYEVEWDAYTQLGATGKDRKGYATAMGIPCVEEAGG